MLSYIHSTFILHHRSCGIFAVSEKTGSDVGCAGRKIHGVHTWLSDARRPEPPQAVERPADVPAVRRGLRLFRPAIWAVPGIRASRQIAIFDSMQFKSHQAISGALDSLAGAFDVAHSPGILSRPW